MPIRTVLAITVMNLCSVMGATVLAEGFSNGSTPLIVVSPDKIDSFSLIMKNTNAKNTTYHDKNGCI